MSVNSKRMLERIKRHLDILGVPATNDDVNVVVDNLTISAVDASIQSPMGGVDGNVSPYLGIGIVAPHKLKIKGDAGQNTIAAIMTSALRLQILKIVGDFSCNVIIEAGDTATQLAEIRGNVDLPMMGQ